MHAANRGDGLTAVKALAQERADAMATKVNFILVGSLILGLMEPQQ
jgi:hypothetical protein